MKRDFDLIRQILLTIELGEGPAAGLSVDGYEATIVHEHIKWLQQAGYIDALLKELRDGSIHTLSVRRLTWNGCELLDCIRNKDTWMEIKTVLNKTTGAVPASVLLQVAERVTLNRVMQGLD